MPSSTDPKRDRYMHDSEDDLYAGKVLSPTGRIPTKPVLGHSYTPIFQPGLKCIGIKTGKMGPLRLQYNTGPSAWNQQGPIILGDVHCGEPDELSILLDSMCGDCARVKLRNNHDDIYRVCQLCDTVWPGIDPKNRRREAVESTKRKHAS